MVADDAKEGLLLVERLELPDLLDLELPSEVEGLLLDLERLHPISRGDWLGTRLNVTLVGLRLGVELLDEEGLR